MKHASVWLREQLDEQSERYFRTGPAPLAPEPERRLAQQEPLRLVEAMRSLAVEPPHVSLSHLALRFPPVGQFVERFRALLQRRRRFDFDTEVQGLSRVEQAVAFLALLELRKDGEIAISQAAAFAPIRISRIEDASSNPDEGRMLQWTARSA
jgi:chromatin segregation and condensation protein Rec8/ScpA/Scc1 (kleisin family)